MPLKYKINVLDELKSHGHTTYSLIKSNVFSSGTIHKLRNGEILGADGLEKLCKLLHCQPGDILVYVDDSE